MRPLWAALPLDVRSAVERLAGGPVVGARNCAGGFSPGFASRLTLRDRRRVFVKAMDARAWPAEAVTHRTEALVAAALPAAVPAPRLLGTFDEHGWTVLVFEDVDGTAPPRPWDRASLDRVAGAAVQIARVPAPALPGDHPRLGGWAAIAGSPAALSRLPEASPWAAEHLARLAALEADGLAAARGGSLVHFDLYPHNILLTPRRVVFVDWPHARLGSPAVDLVMLLSSAAADGVDPEPVLRSHAGDLARGEAVTAILAAHTGFLLAGGLATLPDALAAIATEKLRLGLGALDWLRRRLQSPAP